MSVTYDYATEKGNSKVGAGVQKSAVVSGLIGATFAQFAARNLANAALNSFSVPLAKKVKSTFLSPSANQSVAPKEYIQENFQRIYDMTTLIYQKFDESEFKKAERHLERSLDSFCQIVTDDGAGDFTEMNLKLALASKDECLEALAIFDNMPDKAVWIGGYFTAASQYCFICRQLLQYQTQKHIFGDQKVVYEHNVVQQIDKCIDYVTRKVDVKKMLEEVNNKVGEVKKHDSTYYGFRYYKSDGSYNTLVNKSQSSLTECSNEIRKTAIDLVETQIIQPDVVRTWELTKLAIEDASLTA